jgi:hypothetical protein
MRKLILALALTGIMGTAVMAENNETADNGHKKTSKVLKVNKKNKKKRKYNNRTTRKHKRSGNKYNA